jgi:hypothetical protein
MDPYLPLAFCPHDHRCGWERLDASGAPIRRPLPGDGWWRRSSIHADADVGLGDSGVEAV